MCQTAGDHGKSARLFFLILFDFCDPQAAVAADADAPVYSIADQVSGVSVILCSAQEDACVCVRE